MTASYFRELASRCRSAAVNCFDLSAKEEFRGLAREFDAKASELERAQPVDDRHAGHSSWLRKSGWLNAKTDDPGHSTQRE
jgi:hypothetical protein